VDLSCNRVVVEKIESEGEVVGSKVEKEDKFQLEIESLHGYTIKSGEVTLRFSNHGLDQGL
jgi:hypothetical protein